MQVNVRLYYETGFNLIDRPQSYPVIESSAARYLDVPNIYVVQNVGLTEITVPITYNQTKGIDYVKLTSGTQVIYYVLSGYPQMVNENSCVLPIRQDFITTYGIAKNDFISGQINVAHVPVDDWRYSQIPEDRFTPPGILELKQQEIGSAVLGGTNNETYKTIMNSTIDPVDTAKNEMAIINTGFGVLDSNHSGNISVAVPKVEKPSSNFKTEYRIRLLNSLAQTSFKKYFPPYYTYFLEDSDVDLTTYSKEQDTLNFIRSLGLIDSIISMYDVNTVYVNTLTLNPREGTRVLKVDDNSSHDKTYNLYEQCVTYIEPIFKYVGQNSELNSIFNYEYSNGYTPQNKKVYSGPDNAYVLVSKCTGNKVEINPEDCMLLSSNTPTTTTPVIVVTADLRAGGAPKAFFQYMYNTPNTAMLGVDGMSWANHQNNFYGQYGTELVNNQFRLNSSANIEKTNYASIKNYAGVVAGLGQSVLGIGQTALGLKGIGGTQNIGAALTGVMSGGVDATLQGLPLIGNQTVNVGAGTLKSGLGNFVGGIGNVASNMYNEFGNELNYRQEKARLDYANMMATGATKSPIIEFPFSESSREIFGNYFTLYRKVYTASQMKQMDNFYTLWGYKVGGIDITGETDNWLSNRQYFNYISMTNVELKKSGLSMLERDGLASDLASVRLWKVLPTTWNQSMGNPIVSIPSS